MRRAVYIGGFGNGKRSAEGVADGIAEASVGYYDDVYPFTFSGAMDNPNIVRRATQNVDVFTHSAGMLALRGTSPRRIEAFSAPLPTTRGRLIRNTLLKTARMHTPGIGIRSAEDFRNVNVYNTSALAELLAHPKGNLGRLGQIACFNAVEIAIAAQQSDIPTHLTYTDGDEYFSLSDEDESRATHSGVKVKRITGIHDELVIRPVATLRRSGVGLRI